MLNRFYLITIILFGTVQLRAQYCVDSVVASLPFFHVNTLDETMGDDWDFEEYPNDTVDYAYQITLTTNRNIYVDTCDPITDFDTMLGIFDGCGNTISIVY